MKQEHIAPLSDPVLIEIVERLVVKFRPNVIYLFGSKARGDDTLQSDYDLMVVIQESKEPKYRRMQKAQEILRGIWKAADILVWTKEEFERSKSVVCSLPATILREGRQVYAAT